MVLKFVDSFVVSVGGHFVWTYIVYVLKLKVLEITTF